MCRYEWTFPNREQGLAVGAEEWTREARAERAALVERITAERKATESEDAVEEDDDEETFGGLPPDVIDAIAHPFRTTSPLMAMEMIWSVMECSDEIERGLGDDDRARLAPAFAANRESLQAAVDHIVFHEFILTGNAAIIRPVAERLTRVEAEARSPRRPGRWRTRGRCR